MLLSHAAGSNHLVSTLVSGCYTIIPDLAHSQPDKTAPAVGDAELQAQSLAVQSISNQGQGTLESHYDVIITDS